MAIGFMHPSPAQFLSSSPSTSASKTSIAMLISPSEEGSSPGPSSLSSSLSSSPPSLPSLPSLAQLLSSPPSSSPLLPPISHLLSAAAFLSSSLPSSPAPPSPPAEVLSPQTLGGREMEALESLSDDEEEEEFLDGEPSACPSPASNSGSTSSPGRKNLHSQKIERITHKVWKLLREFNLPKDLDYRALDREILATLHTMPSLKVKKKTVNQSTAVVAYYILKKRVFSEIQVEDVITALKKIERSHTLSRSSKPNYSRNHSEVLGITKLASSLESSLESRASPKAEEGHAKSSIEATRNLCRDLQLGEDVQELAARLSRLSEDSSLASRHLASVSASLVLVAARRLKKKITLTRVAEVANVSSCTIRKAVKAVEELLAQKGEPSF